MNYKGLQALVIDDFDSFRMTVVKMLEEFGCKHVDSMMTGVQAVKACRAKSYDLVLCDYNLGAGQNGQQILEELRVKGLLKPATLFFIVSAESSKSIVLAAYDNEPSAYLTKPITAKSLKQRLDRQLRQREEMLPLFQAIEEGDLGAAITEGSSMVKRGVRSAPACQKLLGNLLLESNQLDAAEAIFKQVLEVRPLEWAQVGMARVKKARGDFSTADTWLQKIIADSPFCMQAYDELIDSYQQQGKTQEEQAVLEAAVDISPMSILRQTSLAKAASRNNDLAVAAKSYSRTVRLGQHSVHDDLENHLELGRTTAALFSEDEQLASDISREALKALENASKRFELTTAQRQQTTLLESQMYAHRGDKRRASDMLMEMQSALKDDESELELDVQLDLIGTLQALDLKDKAEQQLGALIEKYKDDQAALQKIDALMDEPLSELNQRRVSKINGEGIAHYKAKRYQEAVSSFRLAKQLFPRNLGVHLNLVQTLVSEMTEFGRTDAALELCVDSMKRFETVMNANHKQFKRYRHLQEMVRKLGQEIKN